MRPARRGFTWSSIYVYATKIWTPWRWGYLGGCASFWWRVRLMLCTIFSISSHRFLAVLLWSYTTIVNFTNTESPRKRTQLHFLWRISSSSLPTSSYWKLSILRWGQSTSAHPDVWEKRCGPSTGWILSTSTTRESGSFFVGCRICFECFGWWCFLFSVPFSCDGTICFLLCCFFHFYHYLVRPEGFHTTHLIHYFISAPSPLFAAPAPFYCVRTKVGLYRLPFTASLPSRWWLLLIFMHNKVFRITSPSVSTETCTQGQYFITHNKVYSAPNTWCIRAHCPRYSAHTCICARVYYIFTVVWFWIGRRWRRQSFQLLCILFDNHVTMNTPPCHGMFIFSSYRDMSPIVPSRDDSRPMQCAHLVPSQYSGAGVHAVHVWLRLNLNVMFFCTLLS